MRTMEILGKPVVFSDDLPTVGEIKLGDWSSYIVTVYKSKEGGQVTVSNAEKCERFDNMIKRLQEDFGGIEAYLTSYRKKILNYLLMGEKYWEDESIEEDK